MNLGHPKIRLGTLLWSPEVFCWSSFCLDYTFGKILPLRIQKPQTKWNLGFFHILYFLLSRGRRWKKLGGRPQGCQRFSRRPPPCPGKNLDPWPPSLAPSLLHIQVLHSAKSISILCHIADIRYDCSLRFWRHNFLFFTKTKINFDLIFQLCLNICCFNGVTS